jgi:iron complex outermembrane receptor protein
MSKKIVIAGLASGLACLVPLTALAQAAAAAAGPAASAPANEIMSVTITAQKRKEDIRDVPLSVSVISAEQLKAAQISTVEDLTRNVPNISFTSQAGPGLGTVEIRGVSSQAGNAVVSVYLDDISLTTRNLYSQGTAEPRFFDLEDIEVLRGPQGTLYGASSVGGTIKYISKQPDLKNFSGSATASVSFTDHGGTNWETQGVLNIPLVKNGVALRIGVDRAHDSGYIDQVDQTTLKKIAHDINGVDTSVVKLALKADLGGGWSLTPALFAQLTNSSDIDATYLSTQDGTALPRFETSKTVREPGHDRLVLPSLTAVGDLDIGTFTGVLSGYKRRFNRVQDGTNINSVYIGEQTTDPALGAIVGALPSAVQLNNNIDQTSVEMRMASKDYDPKGGNPFTWIGGVFVSDAKTQVYDNEPIFGITKAFQDAGQDVNNPDDLADSFPNAFVNDSSYYSARHYHDKQRSVFGELTYHPISTLSATAGLRYLKATQHFTREGNYYYAGEASSAVIDAKWTATTPSFKVNWAVDPDTSLYSNVSKGFRLGGANRPVPDTALVESDLASLGLPGHPPASFDPDKLMSYELGSKSSLLSHRLTLNVAAFFLDWKNLQQDVTLPNAGFDFETNTGKARSYGLEVELRALVTSALTLNASAGLTHATFSQNVASLGTDDDGNFNVRKGDRIQGVPTFSANLGFDYHWAVNDVVGAFVRGNGQFTGKSHGSLFRGDTDYNRPSYFTADMSTGVNFDKWEFTAFVKNVGDNHAVIQRPNIQSVDEAYYLRPRTIGVTGNYEF